ncbi:hypothetical protein Ctob_006182 [Chrysochromulina tobinii]|uniref:Uncharacterized protein n=1 Tax=Chrysochromulina tobinii TaxID=1460289 RepID=A0A0M0JRK8_9EUKA|nr:hypothetical protein Ctob_006182 [Chrysochromulina tobinii]|eukprot:KOO29110.1 hypothetical protein Ctob_006182 [Chrysochromulina sp. CCMP291]
MQRSLILLASALAAVAANLAETWPQDPVGKTVHARALAGSGPPSSNDIAQYNIILFSSIALVFISYFSVMALVNMDIGNDSLLYSGGLKTD